MKPKIMLMIVRCSKCGVIVPWNVRMENGEPIVFPRCINSQSSYMNCGWEKQNDYQIVHSELLPERCDHCARVI